MAAGRDAHALAAGDAGSATCATAALRTSFAIGFLILFAFIGTFTYVNFVLARAPLALSPMALGLVYFVFLPALLTTPLAGRAVRASARSARSARRSRWPASACRCCCCRICRR